MKITLALCLCLAAGIVCAPLDAVTQEIAPPVAIPTDSVLSEDETMLNTVPDSAEEEGVTLEEASSPSGEEILELIDRNLSSENRIISSKMIVHGGRSSRTIGSKTWSEGEERAYTEYLSPAREQGTKMLKLGDKLWMFSPSTDRTIQISGHMLRQSVMGSDLSYEDMMDDPKLASHYEAEVSGEETVDGRHCWIVSLTARTGEVAYHSRKIWVDRERLIPLRQELFAKSGVLLKNLELTDVAEIDGRWYPMRMVFKDMLKKGEGTEFIVESIEFNAEIPDHIFTKASLR